MLEVGISYRYPQAMRLDKCSVTTLLSSGIRLSGINFQPLTAKLKQSDLSYGRLAISVPKRLIKSSVDRNCVKRIVREVFRQHQLRTVPIDILVNLSVQIDIKNYRSRMQLREALIKLFTLVINRMHKAA